VYVSPIGTGDACGIYGRAKIAAKMTGAVTVTPKKYYESIMFFPGLTVVTPAA
jgi:hypothetical protein